MLWIESVRQRVPDPADIQQLRTAIEEEWENIPQATINSLINSIRKEMRQMVVTPDTDWFSELYLYSQSCEIHRLGPNELI